LYCSSKKKKRSVAQGRKVTHNKDKNNQIAPLKVLEITWLCHRCSCRWESICPQKEAQYCTKCTKEEKCF